MAGTRRRFASSTRSGPGGSFHPPGPPSSVPLVPRLQNFGGADRISPPEGSSIADQGADPFILSRSTGKILFATHGEGDRNPGEAFDNVAQMAVTLAAVSELLWTLWEQHQDLGADPDAAQARQLIDLLSPFYPSRAAAIEAINGLGIRV